MSLRPENKILQSYLLHILSKSRAWELWHFKIEDVLSLFFMNLCIYSPLYNTAL